MRLCYWDHHSSGARAGITPPRLRGEARQVHYSELQLGCLFFRITGPFVPLAGWKHGWILIFKASCTPSGESRRLAAAPRSALFL